MKNKLLTVWLLAETAAIFLMSHSIVSAADGVVVLPLGGETIATEKVRTVMSAGQIWMDRNLGAHGVATKIDDPDAYGTLYQWGRLGDGHEYRQSLTTLTKSLTDVPGHGNFIRVQAKPNPPYDYDWRSAQNDNLWQGEAGTNNPCPAGFRLPTQTEWLAERNSWSNNGTEGAFASPLKLPVAGLRMFATGFLSSVGSGGYYWSSTPDGAIAARRLVFLSNFDLVGSGYRAYGMSVRCIKD